MAAVSLMVDDAISEDVNRGLARIDAENMLRLGLREGGILAIEGKRKTTALVKTWYGGTPGGILMDSVTRYNARSDPGDSVLVSPCIPKVAGKIVIQHVEAAVSEVSSHGGIGKIFEDLKFPGKKESCGTAFDALPLDDKKAYVFKRIINRPFISGDFFDLEIYDQLHRFSVVSTEPTDVVVVKDQTQVIMDKRPANVPSVFRAARYQDVGGLKDEINKLREIVEIPLMHPEIFDRLGISAPNGILLYGAPGTGKTLIAQVIANETRAHFISVNGPGIISKYVGESEQRLREIFDQAKKKAPTIIFIDEIDALTLKRDEFSECSGSARLVSQLLTLMDDMLSDKKVVVIGATNRINSIDPALRRPGRFDREVEIGIPDRAGRWEILRIHTRGMPLNFWDTQAATEFFYNKINYFEEDSTRKIEEKNKKISQSREDLEELNRDLNSHIIELQNLETRKKQADAAAGKGLDIISDEIAIKKNQIDELNYKIDNLNDCISKNEKDIKLLEDHREIISKRADYINKNKKICGHIINKLEQVKNPGEFTGNKDTKELFYEIFQNENDPDKQAKEVIRDLIETGIISRAFIVEAINESVSRIMLEDLASVTHGFVGADIAALCREAAMNALERSLPYLNLEKKVIPPDVLLKIDVIGADFDKALREVSPSGMREIAIHKPDVKWNDIGGLENVKQLMKELIEWPYKYPGLFKAAGVVPASGILLYGPPGCGKTLIAKAVAGEADVNFISVKGSELISMWYGKTEENIRSIFKKAREMAPSIIFFDEIDSLIMRRGADIGSSHYDRIVNQILVEMDGIDANDGVTVLGATNRVDMMDPAVLRSGRFDILLLIPAPDLESRKKIFAVHTRKMKLSGDIDPDALAEKTDGFIGSDIAEICRKAGMQAIRSHIERHGDDADKSDLAVRWEDFMSVLKKSEPSLPKEELSRYEKYKVKRETFKAYR